MRSAIQTVPSAVPALGDPLQGPLKRAVFLLGAWSGTAPGSRPGTRVRVVGRSGGNGPDHRFRARTARLCDRAATVR